MKRIITITLAMLMIPCLLSGCNDTVTPPMDDGTAPAPASDMFTNRDYEISYSESDCIRIELNGDSAAASDKSVKIEGSTVTITKDASYMISGKLSDGMIIVDAPDTAKMQLVLSGVDITSKTSAALYILEADKVFLTTAPNSVNTLSCGEGFTAIDENNIDAAIYSKQDLTINGSGVLTVNSPAGHGIAAKDDLVISSGAYTINAAAHGLDVNDSVRIIDATITVTAGKDGIHAENKEDASKGFVYIASGTLKIEAEGDGISSGAYMQIEDGNIDILAGGGYENGAKEASGGRGGFMGGKGGFGGKGSFGGGDSFGGKGGFGGGDPNRSSQTPTTEDSSTSMKGLKSGSDMLISGGTFRIDSADDAVHSNTNLVINGGEFAIATGDDAFHAEEKLDMAAGTIEISTSYEGLEALHIHISGGNISLVATDDGLNAAGGNDESGSIIISGGALYINASGDGIDANGTLEITGGHTTIVGPIQGDTATLDYDKSGTISGGTFIGTGSSMMAQSFSDSTQGVVAVNADSRDAGTVITLADKNGNLLITHTPELPFAVVILSSPELAKGETYILTVGEQSAEITAS